MKSQEMGPEVRSIVLEKQERHSFKIEIPYTVTAQEDIERIMEAYNGLAAWLKRLRLRSWLLVAFTRL